MDDEDSEHFESADEGLDFHANQQSDAFTPEKRDIMTSASDNTQCDAALDVTQTLTTADTESIRSDEILPKQRSDSKIQKSEHEIKTKKKKNLGRKRGKKSKSVVYEPTEIVGADEPDSKKQVNPEVPGSSDSSCDKQSHKERISPPKLTTLEPRLNESNEQESISGSEHVGSELLFSSEMCMMQKPEKDELPESDFQISHKEECITTAENEGDFQESKVPQNDKVKLLNNEETKLSLSRDSSASSQTSNPVDQAGFEKNDDLWNPELLTATASNLVREVGDGLSSLAGALSQVVKFTKDSDKEDPVVLERRKQRAIEEKAESAALSEAWSNVWNTAWGSNDGWDVNDIDILEPQSSEPKPKNNEQFDLPNASHQDTQISQDKSASTGFWDWSGVSSFAQQLTSSFQTTGFNIVQESVNVLEKIGKKTMSVIEENDPGFQYTKTLLRPSGFQERPNLSQVIREAHERHQREQVSEVAAKEFNRGSFAAQLEANRALIHLEALELVSAKAESQLHIQLDRISTEEPGQEVFTLHGGVLESIWRILQLDVAEEEEEFPDPSTWKVLKCKKQQNPGSYGTHPVGLSDENALVWVAFERSLLLVKTIYPGERLLQNITKVWEDTKNIDMNLSSQEVFYNAISALAETTSAQLEYLHKLAECTLVRTHKPTADFERLTAIVAIQFRSVMKITDALCSEYTLLIKSAHKAKKAEKPTKSASQLVGSLLLECGNAQNYLKNAAHFMVPVFQLACVNTKRATTEAE